MRTIRKEADYFPESATDSGPLDGDSNLDDLAAQLAATAYGVALQHGLGATWLDVELDLWAALTRAIKLHYCLER